MSRQRQMGALRAPLALSCLASLIFAYPAGAQPVAASQPADGGDAARADEIVVTARKRTERLISVPVTVKAFSAEDVNRYKTDDLARVAEMTPGVAVGVIKTQGGSTIGIRGISTSPAQVGFEQAVSVSIDGVQTSDGRIGYLAFFDVERIEVLKGPQALFFGKNSPAGVISVVSAGPTSELQATGKASYEFVGDEVTLDAAVSGPLAPGLGFRVAGRYRNLDGWLRNRAGPLANPAYNASIPIAASTVPGAADKRPGSRELDGRLTLVYDAGTDFNAVLKVTGIRARDSGSGLTNQNVGPCIGGLPTLYGAADPFGDCVPDNRTSNGDFNPFISQSFPRGNSSGRAYGKVDAITGSLAINAGIGLFHLTSTTGYNSLKVKSQQGNDQTTFSMVTSMQQDSVEEISQELRLQSEFDGMFNFMIGSYYQDVQNDVYNDAMLALSNYNPANGRFDLFERTAEQHGKSFSVFGQLTLKPTEMLELTAGARWSSEKKRYLSKSLYGQATFNSVNTIFPGSTVPGEFGGRYKDNNISPEVTVAWRPDQDRTIYASYKTGYKSGGFALTTPIQVTSTIADVDIGAEKASGFEIGAKGLFADRRLRLSAAIFHFKYKDLQVTSYDPTKLAFSLDNAGQLRQTGAELEAKFQANDILTLYGSVSYARNRFRDFVGQCYGFTFAPGTVRATATPPPNCRFTNTTTLALQQDFDGRAPARSPDLTGNVGFLAEIPVGDLHIGLSGDAAYTDGYYGSESMPAASYQSSFWRLNGRVSLHDEDRWEAALVGRNLTNKYYVAYTTDRVGGAVATGGFTQQRGVVSRGREIMLQLNTKF